METLKYIIGMGFVLGLGFGSALGQGIESCSQCVCVADNTCDESIYTCNSETESDCETKTFTASCSGTYILRYSLSCPGSACAECFACVLITDSNGELLATCHGPCTANNCSSDCDATVSLTADEEYKLKVCKKICFGGSCSNCTSCVARAYVFTGGAYSSVCSSIPACNP